MALATQTGVHTKLTPEDASLCGMTLAVIAREHPDRLAIASPCGDRSFDFLNARVNQLVRTLRARGIREGDSVALICSNRPELAVAVYAAQRAGWRLTPINWHLTGDEIAYIVGNCEARALLADVRFGPAVERAVRLQPERPVALAIGGPIHGFEDYEDALGSEEPHDIDDPVLGSQMLYTSGTTGLPKGVHRTPLAQRRQLGLASVIQRIGYQPGRDLNLATGPLYHAAPLVFSLVLPLNFGCGVLMMDGWGAERALELIAGYRVTHTHMVPIMFHQLLALPEEVRARYDVSSLKMVLHGAAPCPLPTKRAMMEWLGPILWEYYAATEGWGCFASPEEWLERPGTVGRPESGHVVIRDDEGKDLPPGTPGTIYLSAPEGRAFEYYKDPEKTRITYAGDFFSLGDIGHLDAEGYLYLNDRSADIIISGGVNVYPAEVDAVLLAHPSVQDAATVGAPDDEWGERVVSVVMPTDGEIAGPELAERLLEHCQTELAQYKCPRRIDFAPELPRTEAGKIHRRSVRDRYWEGRERRI